MNPWIDGKVQMQCEVCGRWRWQNRGAERMAFHRVRNRRPREPRIQMHPMCPGSAMPPQAIRERPFAGVSPLAKEEGGGA